MAIFGPRPWVNPFGKLLNFRLFELLFLKHRNVFFSSRISQNTFSWPILPKKNQLQLTHLEEYQFFEFFLFRLSYNTFCWPILAKKKNGKTAIFGPNPLEKSQFFEFLNLFFYIAQKSVFSFQNIVKHTFLAYIA